MRFQVSMISKLVERHEETFIANNKKEAIRYAQTFNPNSKVIKAIWV